MNRARYLPGIVKRIVFGSRFIQYEKLQRIGRVQVGVGTYGIPKVELFAYDNTRLVIGSYTSIAKAVTFILGGNHPLDRVTTYPLRIMRRLPGAGQDGYPSSKGDVRVGSDVWIAYGATILSGVHIGNGAVVSARSVVASDVPDYGVVGGNPAKLIRYRFDPEVRLALLQISWWSWPDWVVDSAAPHLAGNDIASFIAWAHERNGSRDCEPER